MPTPFSDIKVPADVLYLSFRGAVLATYDLMTLQFGPQEIDVSGRGPLECLSFLRGTAQQIQLQVLLQTWSRLQPDTTGGLTDVDFCVCYCAATELARQTELNREHHMARLKNGPRPFTKLAPLWITSKLRIQQLTWPFPANATTLLNSGQLLNDQLDAIPSPDGHEELVDSLLRILGMWHIEHDVLQDAHGLLTESEALQFDRFFSKNRGLLNL